MPIKGKVVPRLISVDNQYFTFLDFSQIENLLKSRSRYENIVDERIKTAVE